MSVKKEYIAELEGELGEVFYALGQEVNWMQAIWGEFEQLYATSPAHVDLLNRSAPFFFSFLQKELWHGTLLRIRRLTDPPRTRNRENLTILRLPGLCLQPLATEVQTHVDNAVQAAQFARDWGNRQVAHLDLDLSLGKTAQTLQPATREATRAAIAAIHGVLNCISQELMGATMMGKPIIGPAGAATLMSLLADGLALSETRKKLLPELSQLPEELRRPARI